MAGNKIYWGVDSLMPANSTSKVPGGQTLYDFVASKERAPDFWGRYIVGIKGQVLTKAEAGFLLKKKCRILPIFNGITARSVKGNRAVGASHAKQAIAAAAGLGIPHHTYLYANIEVLWKPSKDWMLGWWEEMFSSHYGGAGGFYCSPAPFNSWFNTPYKKAMAETKKSGRVLNIRYFCPLFASGPLKGCAASRTSTPFKPFRSPANPDSTALWQYAINCHKVGKHGLFDKDFANERGYRSLWH